MTDSDPKALVIGRLESDGDCSFILFCHHNLWITKQTKSPASAA